MLSHDHLSLLDEPLARKITEERQFIGTYIPTRLEWVGALKNKPWQSEGEKESLFQWRLNLSSCLAFLSTVESCIKQYGGDVGNQAVLEEEIVGLLSEAWRDGPQTHTTVRKLREHLEDIEYRNNQRLATVRALDGDASSLNPVGIAFDTEVFSVLRRGIALLSRVLEFPTSCVWLVCVDEAEFLDPIHHRILNSCLRAFPGNLRLKLTTMPYCHYTLDTNTSVPLDVGDDFEYVYVDSDPVLFERTSREFGTIGTQFGRRLFSKRAEASGFTDTRSIRLRDLLGDSPLIDPKEEDWQPGSPMMRLLEKHASRETFKRAKKLAGTPKFLQAIGRKIGGALLLREARAQLKGHQETDIYAGASMAIRCGDANPRRLIRIFNSYLLLLNARADRERSPRLSGKDQTRALRKLSLSTLSRVKSEPHIGPELFEFVNLLGEFMHASLFHQPLATDQVSSVEIDANLSDVQWVVIKRAVGLGLLYPNLGSGQSDDMPDREGTFHLAYILAPHFFILPRRGAVRPLSTIVRFGELYQTKKSSAGALEELNQPDLFREDANGN